MRLPSKSAFTLIEILIVVAIVIIISSAAITGSSNLMKGLRFSNHFNQAIFMIEEARSLAVSGKDVNAQSYFVKFGIAANPPTITVFKTKVDASTPIVEAFSFAANSNLIMASTPACSASAVIQFENGTGKTVITCDNGAGAVAIPSLTLSVKETPSGRNKCFAIHQAAGIAQVANDGASCP